MIFTKKVSVTGNYIATFVFTDDAAVTKWLDTEYPALLKEYPNLKYTIGDIPGLEVGDYCHVYGDGTEVYKIVGMVKYSDNNYAFQLDSGWNESVYKCYTPMLAAGATDTLLSEAEWRESFVQSRIAEEKFHKEQAEKLDYVTARLAEAEKTIKNLRK